MYYTIAIRGTFLDGTQRVRRYSVRPYPPRCVSLHHTPEASRLIYALRVNTHISKTIPIWGKHSKGGESKVHTLGTLEYSVSLSIKSTVNIKSIGSKIFRVR